MYLWHLNYAKNEITNIKRQLVNVLAIKINREKNSLANSLIKIALGGKKNFVSGCKIFCWLEFNCCRGVLAFAYLRFLQTFIVCDNEVMLLPNILSSFCRNFIKICWSGDRSYKHEVESEVVKLLRGILRRERIDVQYMWFMHERRRDVVIMGQGWLWGAKWWEIKKFIILFRKKFCLEVKYEGDMGGIAVKWAKECDLDGEGETMSFLRIIEC